MLHIKCSLLVDGWKIIIGIFLHLNISYDKNIILLMFLLAFTPQPKCYSFWKLNLYILGPPCVKTSLQLVLSFVIQRICSQWLH
jgi:hypothetical protein